MKPLKYREYIFWWDGMQLYGMRFLTKLPPGAKKVLKNPEVWTVTTKEYSQKGVYSKICRVDWNGHFGQTPDYWKPGHTGYHDVDEFYPEV